MEISMYIEKLVIFMGVLFPLTFSPGPASVMMAAFGARFSYKQTFPFLAGVTITVLFQSLAIGFGIAEFIYKNPTLLKYIKFTGALYIVYLAYKLFRSSRTVDVDKIKQTPKFLEGVILQLLNIKVIAFTLVLFPQFIEIDLPKLNQILLLSFGNFIMVFASTSTWVLGGDWISKKFATESFIRIQGYVFGGLLIIVAIWMLM